MGVNSNVNLFFRFAELLIELNQLNARSMIIRERICLFSLAYIRKYLSQLRQYCRTQFRQ